MLKGISPCISPQLLQTLAEMGHGDELIIGDCNFPAASTNPRCIRADGLQATQLVDAILALFPLDTFCQDAPVTIMDADPGILPESPPIWAQFQAIVEKHQPGTPTAKIDRFAFYERARNAYATVATSETAFYACIILKKGTLL